MSATTGHDDRCITERETQHGYWRRYSVCLRAAAILYGSVLHAKLTPSMFGNWLGADQASTGSGMTKAGMVVY